MSDTSKKYFRHEVYPEYKAHRTGGERPMLLSELGKWILDTPGYRPYLRPGLEADDILGILATHPTLVPGEKVVVTVDKDLYQIAGFHYNPRKPQQGVFTQTPAAADHFFYRQCLSGDPTDGVPGCPRIGPVKAEKILSVAYEDWNDCNDNNLPMPDDFVWCFICDAYALQGKNEAYALQQARCVRILRHTDYDFANKKPILWTPKTSQP